jgi:hypothetical protein
MPYSKWALLTFGGGLLLGLVVVSAELPVLGWVASLAMAGGVALLPIALVADWWSRRPWRTPKPKPRGSQRSKKATRSRAAATGKKRATRRRSSGA